MCIRDSTTPYVLLNHKNTYDGLSTLCHEMGHAMHSFYSNKTQPATKARYKIFVAEVASTCNEILLSEYLRKKYADNKQAQIADVYKRQDQCRRARRAQP